MVMLRIHLFGVLRVMTDDQPNPLRLTPVIQNLLAYLLLNTNQPQPRDVLAEMFWGNYSPEQARGCLNTALWRLRRLLEQSRALSEGLILVTNSQGDVVFNLTGPHWLDLEEFQAQVNRVLDRPYELVLSPDVDALIQAMDLYTGDLLEGCYDDWAIRQRERVRLLYLSALTWLVHYFHNQRDYERGLGYARCILELDPLREDIHREVMQMCMLSGQRPLALKQFETCREILKQEMGIAPMEETSNLYYQILISDSQATIPITGSDEESDMLALALAQFQKVRKTLDQVQEQFQAALQVLENLQQKINR